MGPMVSARVPAKLHDRTNEQLNAMGSTPAELINRACSEFVSAGKLPGPSSEFQPGRRMLGETERAKLTTSISAASSPVPESYFADKLYDEILEAEHGIEYEELEL